MKKMILLLAFAALTVAGSAFAGVLPGTGINGSPHDMNTKGSSDALGRTCVFCHTPHNAIPGSSVGVDINLPLWNHELTSNSVVWQSYQGAWFRPYLPLQRRYVPDRPSWK